MIKKIESASANRLMLLGVVLLIIGFIAIIQPLYVEKVLLWIIGLVMIVGGGVQALRGFRSEDGSEKSFNTVVGLITLLIGIFILVCWFSLLAFFTVIIGILFLLQGVWTLMVAFSARHASGHVVMVLSGALSLIVAIMILARWPSSTEYVVGILFGVNFILYGAGLLSLGSTLKSSKIANAPSRESSAEETPQEETPQEETPEKPGRS